jgi:hypothetical protein
MNIAFSSDKNHEYNGAISLARTAIVSPYRHDHTFCSQQWNEDVMYFASMLHRAALVLLNDMLLSPFSIALFPI